MSACPEKEETPLLWAQDKQDEAMVDMVTDLIHLSAFMAAIAVSRSALDFGLFSTSIYPFGLIERHLSFFISHINSAYVCFGLWRSSIIHRGKKKTLYIVHRYWTSSASWSDCASESLRHTACFAFDYHAYIFSMPPSSRDSRSMQK